MSNPNTVRAKFRVHNIGVNSWGTRVQMSPVYSDDPSSENKRFWDATPSGDLDITIKNEAAAALFQLHKEYYMDFTPAEEAPAVTPAAE